MTHLTLSTSTDRVLGVAGLFLMLIVARLAERAYSTPQTVAGYVAAFLARRAIDGVAAIGWVVDRLPLPDSGNAGAHARAVRLGASA